MYVYIVMKWPEQKNGTSRLSTNLQYKMDGTVWVNCTVQVGERSQIMEAFF